MFQKMLRKAVPFAVMVTVLAGCQPNTANTNGNAGSDVPLDTATATPAEMTLPLSKEPVELDVTAILSAPQGKSSFNEIPLFGEMEKITGVKARFSHATNEKMNLLFASNDLPDIVINYWANGSEKKAYNDEQILRLDNLMAQYAPNYTKLLKQDPELHAQAVDADGFLYTFQLLRNAPELRVYNGFMIRQDWLDKLNLDMPTTLDELYQVLKAFKEGDPNGNGVADESPWIMEKGNAFDFIPAWWGIADFYLDAENTVQCGWLQPEWREMITYLNKLYQEGLLDADYAIDDNNQFSSKVSNGIGGMWFGFAGGTLGRLNKLMESIDPEFRQIGMPWIKSADGNAYVANATVFRSPVSDQLGLAVSASCKNPELAVKWADFAYSEQGGRLLSFGIEGESYTMENGIPTYTDLIKKNPDSSMADMLSQHTVASGYPFEQSIDYFNQYMTDKQKDAINIWKECDTSRILPVLKYTDEELPIINTKFNEILSYNKEMLHKFVTGKESLDNFDTYQQTLKNMGIADVVKVKQDAYSRVEGMLNQLR